VNFFDAQDQARRLSRRLVFVYALATAVIVIVVTALMGLVLQLFSGLPIRDQAGALAFTGLLTTLFIVGSSLYKTSRLSAGGGRVAVDMGGTLVSTSVQDPLRRRLRNVVEEMAIASGVPVPEIYVLEEEQGINAFAAGFSPSDAAVAVTRGTLELLNRDELQGVIAHEFSHILNGDMKLNVRLMGVLFGIMSIGLIGRFVLRGAYRSGNFFSRRNRVHPAILMLGAGLAVLGAIGVFFARMIKAGVSRQREFLADASAVQFTRQSDGISGALKKIGGYGAGSRINATDPEQVSHMLFGSGAKLQGLFATHPPLADRIRALEPGFREEDFPRVDQRQRDIAVESAADSGAQRAAFAGDVTTAIASGGREVLVDSIVETVGQPTSEHVDFARDLRLSIPETLYHAAHSSEFAYLLVLSLILDRSGRVTERQFALVQEQLGVQRAQLVRNYFSELGRTGAEYRLPLLEVAFPALKLRPATELSYLASLTTRLIEIDGEIELFEFCFYRVMISNLNRAKDPTGKHHGRRSTRKELQAAALDLLQILADYGHEHAADKIAAFEDGLASLGAWATGTAFEPRPDQTMSILSQSLDILQGLNSKGQGSLLRALSAAAAHDGQLSVAEAELVRAVCATLNYPLPPILVHR
jgi:Zn-dependent protease with chaperone function